MMINPTLRYFLDLTWAAFSSWLGIISGVFTLVGAYAMVRGHSTSPEWFHRFFPLLIGILFLVTICNAALKLNRTCEKEKQALESQIVALQKKPYLEEHRRLVADALKPLNDADKALLKRLLHSGEVSQPSLRATGGGASEDESAANRLYSARLAVLGRDGSSTTYKVNPEYAEVLKELLYSTSDQV
jgi:hypothetical protein